MYTSEIQILNRYAAAELAGGLFLGKFARKAEVPFLIARLTNHCYEEMYHSWQWMNFMEQNEIPIQTIHGRNEYFEYMGSRTNVIDFLAAVHVYEIRVPFHLQCHAQMSRISDPLRDLITDICADEKDHLGWVRNYFMERKETDAEHIASAVKEAGEIEERTYRAYIEELKKSDEYAQELASIVEENLSQFIPAWNIFSESSSYDS
ncbi:MAG: hypothetical protein BRC24_01755 [Parcubacteria group bacterium SW_4_46_8]|nr:MAG: hypothetical protein BRC24_01755 [Parcubacteria group bacterium SW_4_46_8]